MIGILLLIYVASVVLLLAISNIVIKYDKILTPVEKNDIQESIEVFMIIPLFNTCVSCLALSMLMYKSVKYIFNLYV